MNKPELISILSDKANATKKQTEQFLDCFVETIIEALKEKERIVISGFGTFEAHERAGRIGRNPNTGEEIKIENSITPTFKASKTFKDSIK